MEKKCFDRKYIQQFLYSQEQIPLFLNKHINNCVLCQTTIVELSEIEPISEMIFRKPFQKQKELWFGAEISNQISNSIPHKDNLMVGLLPKKSFFDWVSLSKGKVPRTILLTVYSIVVIEIIVSYFQSAY
ncbi:hypothetical protein CH373_18400 [Leptospira perolatii]|uniref:Zinc-finger domain-containing protein n=1 Tax=Leptospira perolatii TaxID=2023191 RepID=A0A2M9ZHV4_9LEPT|nr:hypothetical protein [Leptospira perolatii]PJZ68015.1 hypothetical protein CH360_18410 [Leptospira perolatii]PJZ71646.1 hypothetical protein CH373_18400 [Leptospira perolatii]